jgi:hypothetical protein
MRDLYSQIRHLQARDARDAESRPTGRGSGQYPAFVGRVVAHPKLPTATNQYYSVNPVAILGVEAEGTTATLVPDPTSTILVCVIGSKTPSIGDDLVCRFTGNRWVAERFGGQASGGGATIQGCACVSIPTSLHLSASGPCDGVFLPCSLLYGPTPASLSNINLGANCFLSDQTFVDSLSGLSYRYNFGCDTIFFRLSRVYLPTSTSGAFHDSSIYSWSIGQPGNTCKPFLLSNGYIYPGGNTTCIVTVSE